MAVRLLQVINQPCVNRLSLIQSYNAVVNGLFPHTLTWTLNHIGTLVQHRRLRNANFQAFRAISRLFLALCLFDDAGL